MQSNQIESASIWQLLPLAIILSKCSSLLAIALLSFSGFSIAFGLWLLITGGLIFTQSHSIIERIYLSVVISFSTFGTIFVFQNFYSNNLFQAGYDGFIAIFLLVIVAGLLTFTIIVLARIFNWLFSN